MKYYNLNKLNALINIENTSSRFNEEVVLVDDSIYTFVHYRFEKFKMVIATNYSEKYMVLFDVTIIKY